MKNKKHYRAEMNNGTLTFKSHDWSVWYFAGGWEKEVNFLLKKLVQKYGTTEGLSIYQKTIDAMVELWEDWKTNWSKFPCGTLVFYNK